MKKAILQLALLLINTTAFAQQRSVSITIDDVPNVQLFEANGYSSILLKRLDSLALPVAIFINEGNLKQTKSFDKNKELLKSWVLNDHITVGNHSYSHPNYGDIGFDAFKENVVKGETLTREILKGSGKRLEYFRFPFNGMGKDSAAQASMKQFLNSKNYIVTPFTVESEDWLYTQLYEKALREKDYKSAKTIGEKYVQFSLALFDHFDNLSVALYGKPVKQIYLCHDNRLNADYLPVLISQLQKKGYKMISLKEAMLDPVYQSKDYYYGNGGFSWIYRWMKDVDKRRAAMRAEPTNADIQKAYEEMSKAK
ncbi:polysaccharide deacetylase family protein [Dyadobacter pollutisoli]|jgi:peptidoglycan/xylan/chitin deacetylase (PgdA/CDA1 family)|uniref:Polysaccharide deacetylase family protein n=1 Tax=Dyadobacter pollutisoli TaxID=2910158 RepID=A0A9E8NCU3_9BACT|nr:polysaccharide deacetylase family protein [Dyadobacter pollutisoli]WAC12012.1 polysaccharide deacetylase family protein [Dyadobacter pollutisoli]